MVTILYHLFSICVEEQQDAWPGNRVVKCADAYKFGRKCYFASDATYKLIDLGWPLLVIRRKYNSWWDEHRMRDRAKLLECRDIFLRKKSFGMPQPTAALSITNMDETHIFFFALSISFLVPHDLPCSKPVSLVMFLQVIYYLRLCRLVWKRNKMHDREIAL